MTRRAWVRLDNASNIFLAARSAADSKVFRMSAELDHEIDPELLQEAVDVTYDRYPLYHAVLRRGVFWHYLQDSDLRPVVSIDDQHTCAPIYQADRRNLLFRVVYFRRRVVLEIFHALSDGTGALWFLSDILTLYVKLRAARVDDAVDSLDDTSVEDRGSVGRAVSGEPEAARVSIQPEDDSAEPKHELAGDSFAHYFHRRRAPESPSNADAFNAAAEPAVLRVEDDIDAEPRPRRSVREVLRPSVMNVYRPKGTRTPDNRTRAVELTLATNEALALSRAEGVSLTMYLTAMFFESIRLASGGLGKKRTLAVSVPVNLRQFFPSTSARNFFATVRVQYTYGDGPDDLSSIARHLDRQFRQKATPEALERKLRKLIRAERMVVLRIVPRPLKDVLLRLINWGNNRSISVAISNLGRVNLPEITEPHVGRMLFHVSAVRPQFCAVSHAGELTISFTSPFVETGHVKEFARMLASKGIDVKVAAAKVTEHELEEAEA